MPFTNEVRNNDAFQSISLMLQQALLVVKKSRNFFFFLLLVHWVHVHRANSIRVTCDLKEKLEFLQMYNILCSVDEVLDRQTFPEQGGAHSEKTG